MKTTKIEKTRLLEVLKENRKKHKKEYQEAVLNWQKKAMKAYVKAAKKAEDGKFVYYPLQDLPKPEHHLVSYDSAIKRLEYEVEDVVELDHQEFASFVEDNWNWRDQFEAATSLYNNSGKFGRPRR